MNTITKRYADSMTWATAEAIIFQTTLLIHQCILFKVIPASVYGLTGTLFGLIYFTVKLFDLGLSRGLMTFYHEFSSNKKSCLRFFISQLIPNIIFGFFTFLLVWLIHLFWNNTAYIALPIDSSLLALSCGLVATESIKTIFKRLLQLSYNFQQVAFFEVGFITSYHIAIWSYFFYTASLNAHVIIGFCFLMSLCEAVGLLFLTYRWYALLPENSLDQSPSPSSITHIFKNRLLVYGHSISKQFFSANILIPLSAYSFGLQAAALLKLASYVTHSITTILEKIIDPSSSALFVHTKNESPEDKQHFFLLVSTASCHMLLCVLIFIIINCSKLLSFSIDSIAIAPYIVLYFFIHYFENFFITVEKFYIAHDRSDFLIIGTAANCLVGAVVFTHCLSSLSALIILLISRIVTFAILVSYLSLLWNIRPRVKLVPRYILGSLSVSILFFMIF